MRYDIITLIKRAMVCYKCIIAIPMQTTLTVQASSMSGFNPLINCRYTINVRSSVFLFRMLVNNRWAPKYILLMCKKKPYIHIYAFFVYDHHKWYIMTLLQQDQ